MGGVDLQEEGTHRKGAFENRGVTRVDLIGSLRGGMLHGEEFRATQDFL